MKPQRLGEDAEARSYPLMFMISAYFSRMGSVSFVQSEAPL